MTAALVASLGAVSAGLATNAIDPPPVYSESEPYARREWAQAQGGVQASVNVLDVTVQGTSDRAVVLNHLTVEVLTREEPLPGTTVVEPCGSALEERFFDVELDQEPPSVSASTDWRAEVLDGKEEPDPIDFPYTVGAGDPERFTIQTFARSCDCTWEAVLHWQAGEEQNRTVIRDDGKPFRVSAETHAPDYVSYRGGPLEPAP